ncbi:CatB-related O-acetyltransferase [Thiotrichales bacterium 19X7-9]|nr:CatB-related O-acetyltransferase [Thiotrichales bacterium 19X7-9]
MYIYAKILKKLRSVAIKNSIVHKTSKVESGTQLISSRLDRYSFCGYDCDINYCDIGAFTSIANNVVIGGGAHPVDWVAMSPVFYEGRDSVKAKFSTHQRKAIKRTNVGHDVWIGQNVIIKQGVSIGIGAVIGMGSVVTKDVEPYSIVAGNPAKELRKRFNEDIIIQLLKSQWWLFDNKKLQCYASYFKNPVKFLKVLNDEKDINNI